MNALKIVVPVTLTDTMLVSSNVPETDYAAWSSGSTYALGDRVILTSTHKVYESLQGSNTNKDPVTQPLWWVEVSPTNRWRAFDLSNSTATAQASSISYRITPGRAISAFAALNLTGATSLRLRLVDPTYGTVYDKTTDLTALPAIPLWWGWFFSQRTPPSLSVAVDLPAYPAADLLIDLTGGASLSVGVFLFGQMREFGLGIEAGARVGITDYSRKETNAFGDTVLVQRAFSKRANFGMTLPKDEVDVTVATLAGLRAVPCLWIGSAQYESTVIYGYYKAFDIAISYPTFSDCTLEIEGLT